MGNGSSEGSLREVAAVFLLLGTVAFGGPAAHVALMRRLVVERLGWVDEPAFFELFAACNLIPGPSSTELAIILGYKRGGSRGLILAGVCFIGPAMLVMLGLAWVYQRFGSSSWAHHVLAGVTAVVVGILAWAVLDIGRRLIRGSWPAFIGLAVTIAALLYENPLPLLAAGGALFFLRNQIPARGQSGHVSARCFVLPILPAGSILSSKLAVLFGTFLKLGVIAFGSGYVLLFFLRSDFVLSLHWLSERQIVDAIAISQATPGPVFTTATFIGYLVAGVPGGLLATLAIFCPGFILVPPLDRLVRFVRKHDGLREALKGINVAALGLIAAVSLDVARIVIVTPLGLAIAFISFLLLLRQPLLAPAAIIAGGLLGFALPALIA